MKISILNKIKKLWTSSPENWERLVYWWQDDLPITFYSWECPPRKISQDPKFGKFIDFGIDIKKVVQGKKIDQFTEIPRVNTRQKDEKWFVGNIILKNPKANYIKLIADTNAFYLYPKSVKVLGTKKIKKLSLKFKRELESFSQDKINKNFPSFLLFTDLQSKYQKDYEKFFNLVFSSFNNQLKSDFVSKEIVTYWQSRIIKHVGLSKSMLKEKQDLLKRVIASYAAEGMIFDLVSKTGSFPNPVWMNWEESKRSGDTTEILRSRFGINPIPKIYSVKE